MNSSRFRPLASILTVLVLAGCAAGIDSSAQEGPGTTAPLDEQASESTSTTPTSTQLAERSEAAEVETSSTIVMPPVVGMSSGVADESLFALGIHDVRYINEETLEPAGQVLAQLPSEGSLVRGPVTLTIAVPLPAMPDYAGVRIGLARSELTAWGVIVTEKLVLSVERPQGEILGSIPRAGDQIGSEVVLEVAASPVLGKLGVDAALVESGRKGFELPRVGPMTVNGVLFEGSLWAEGDYRLDPGDMAHWEYDLGRSWESLDVTVGLWDGSEFEQAGRFRIILDGAVIWEEDVAFGESLEISKDVSGGLRLRLEVVSLGEGRATLVWGSPQLLGLPEDTIGG